MRLVFLYGPPAAGKLTVARELAAMTGYRLFDNHLTIDLAHAIFPERNAAFRELVGRLRIECLAAAARADASMIFTFVYAAGADDAFVEELTRPVREAGGEVCFAQLLPTREALRQRVEAESRRGTSKIRSWQTLEGLLDANDLTTPIPGSLVIDNSGLPSHTAAAKIVGHFRL